MSNKIVFRRQIIYIFLLTFIPLLLVNLYIFNNMRAVIESVDSAYDGNRNLVEMRTDLDKAHTALREYLNTRDENTLNKFYVNLDAFKLYIEEPEETVEENISELSVRNRALNNLASSYVQSSNMAALAKKSNDIDRYMTYAKEAENRYSYLTTYLSEVNNRMFYMNSDSYKKLSGMARVIEALYTAILLIMGAIGILIVLLLTKKLTDPLKNLADTAKKVGEGNLDVRLVETDELNEIGILNGAFNRMVTSLKDYIEKFRASVEKESALREESIRMETVVKDAELKYLQAQINPHFLFNTLNAGAQLAMMENADRTYTYIHRTADFFRTRIKNAEGSATIEDELKVVDDYIYIINVRYSGSIHYTKEIDEKYLSVHLPSMILQPIVENCVKHGLRDVEWEKKIEITVTGEEDSIVVSIRDNGRGMKQSVIDHIMSGQPMSASEGEVDRESGVGMDNVIARMRNFFNTEDVIEITSVGEDMGTEVALFIPKV